MLCWSQFTTNNYLMHSKYASIIWYSHNYESYILDTYKALTKTLKKNEEFENHYTHEKKSGSS